MSSDQSKLIKDIDVLIQQVQDIKNQIALGIPGTIFILNQDLKEVKKQLYTKQMRRAKLNAKK